MWMDSPAREWYFRPDPNRGLSLLQDFPVSNPNLDFHFEWESCLSAYYMKTRRPYKDRLVKDYFLMVFGIYFLSKVNEQLIEYVVHQAGFMFNFTLKKLYGSYLAFIFARRS